MRFRVEITETLKRGIIVEAQNEDAALEYPRSLAGDSVQRVLSAAELADYGIPSEIENSYYEKLVNS